MTSPKANPRDARPSSVGDDPCSAADSSRGGSGEGADGTDWEQAWQEGRTRWDAGTPAPALLHLEQAGEIAELLDSVSPSVPAGGADRRVVVPGAGSGYDVLTLASKGRSVIGVDLAPSAVQRFSQLRARAEVQGDVEFLTADFLRLSDAPRHRASYDLAWDYTFFCALPPRVRGAWAETMRRLLRPNGVLITLMYPLVESSDVDRTQGPPFPLTRAIYRDHLEPVGFELEREMPVVESHPGREGREALAIWRRDST